MQCFPLEILEMNKMSSLCLLKRNSNALQIQQLFLDDFYFVYVIFNRVLKWFCGGNTNKCLQLGWWVLHGWWVWEKVSVCRERLRKYQHCISKPSTNSNHKLSTTRATTKTLSFFIHPLRIATRNSFDYFSKRREITWTLRK